MTRRALVRSLAASFAAALLLTGTLDGGSRAARAEEKPLKTFRVLDSPKRWLNYELLFLADAKGYFKEQGLKLELVPLPIEQYTVAIDSGVTDFALSADYIYFANVRAKGLKAKEVVASSPYINPAAAGDGVFVPQNSPIKGPEDFRGKTVGMRSVGFSSAWFTLDYLGRNGVKKGEVKFLTIPDLQQEQVLSNGSLDAVFAYPPIDAQLRKRGGFRQLFQISDLAGRRIQRGGTMVKEDYIEKNPDVVRGFVAAIAKAADYANKNQKEVIDLGIALGRLDPELAPFFYTKGGNGDYSVIQWPEHGLIDPEDLKFWVEVAERQEVVPTGALKIEEIYTNAFNPFAKKAGP